MKQAIETARSFVNSWQCDENVHMNVQFYWKCFGDAGQIFHQLCGSKPQRWIDRHVRYHDELGMGSNIIIRSAALAGRRQIVHLMDNGDTGQLSATACIPGNRRLG